MNGASWACGLGPTVRLDKTTVIVRSRTIADYALIEAEILKERRNVYDLIRRALPHFADPPQRAPETCRFLVETIARRWSRTTLADVFGWINTWRGRVFALWLAVRENNPVLYTFERVAAEAAGADWSEIVAAMDQASANDERCAATWPGIGGECDGDHLFWPALLRRLGHSPWYLRPGEVGRLTLQQLRFCLCDERMLKADVEFDSLAQLNEWKRLAAAVTDRAVDNLMHGRRWNRMNAGSG